jgi:hypothetical protein
MFNISLSFESLIKFIKYSFSSKLNFNEKIFDGIFNVICGVCFIFSFVFCFSFFCWIYSFEIVFKVEIKVDFPFFLKQINVYFLKNYLLLRVNIEKILI